MTPNAKQLYDAQGRLIEKAQERMDVLLDNGGSTQASQSLAKAILDLATAQGKLAQQLHPASKIER